MKPRFVILFLITLLFAARPIAAQDQPLFWIQIEAQPNQTRALDRAETYARTLRDVNGFAMGAGWYGIALGPYTREDAGVALRAYRAEGAIPGDSYITQSSIYRDRFFPLGGQAPQTATATAPTPTPAPVANPAPTPVLEPAPVADETPREARASEARLSRDERKELQSWLKWAGFYTSSIDGAFGRGTRRSMQAWQEANGFDGTGVLTTLQRDTLRAQYNAVLKGMDLTDLRDDKAGIEMQVPLGVVGFDKYDYPFAHFKPIGDVDAQVLLISQKGDQSTLFGLYDIMQTLELVPLEGPRERKKNSFVLIGEDGHHVSHTQARLEKGMIKGFTLVWPAGDEERRRRVLTEMQKSFTTFDAALSPSQSDDAGQAIDLVAGLKIRKPKTTASGFFITKSGDVATHASTVASCEEITLDGDYTAKVLGVDPALGLAVLRPEERLAPMGVARLRAGAPRLQSNIAVAGYSYGGVLGAPTLSFGTLQDLRDLSGREAFRRLAVLTLEGDAGGPVYDDGGLVIGMLRPSETGTQKLPQNVSFALSADEILKAAGAMGVALDQSSAEGTIAPEDLEARAGKMTVLVECW